MDERKCERVAKRVVSFMFFKIRDLLDSDLSVDVTNEKQTWSCPFKGSKRLTVEGVARWSAGGILDLPVEIDGDKAIIHNIKSREDENSVCSLFNVLANRVNEYTYKRYVE